MTRIFVDADSCPKSARDAVLRAATKRMLPVIFAANRAISFDMPDDAGLFTMHVCPGTQDAADDYIVQEARAGDLAITRDIPLAKRLLDAHVAVINDRGTVFDDKTVAYMLEERELSLQMRALGVTPKGSFRTYGKKEAAQFCNALDRTLTRLLMG